MADNSANDRSNSDENEGGGRGNSGPDMKTIMVELTPQEYDSLTETKKANGFTWKGMLMHAQRALDD